MRHLLRNVLRDVPVLDDLAVLEPEDVDDGTAARTGLAHRMHMQDHVIAVREYFFDLAVRLGKLLLEEIHECLEALDSIGGTGIVLNVFRAEIFRCRIEVLLVQPGFVELQYGLLVAFQIGGQGRHHRYCKHDGRKNPIHGALLLPE